MRGPRFHASGCHAMCPASGFHHLHCGERFRATNLMLRQLILPQLDCLFQTYLRKAISLPLPAGEVHGEVSAVGGGVQKRVPPVPLEVVPVLVVICRYEGSGLGGVPLLADDLCHLFRLHTAFLSRPLPIHGALPAGYRSSISDEADFPVLVPWLVP